MIANASSCYENLHVSGRSGYYHAHGVRPGDEQERSLIARVVLKEARSLFVHNYFSENLYDSPLAN